MSLIKKPIEIDKMKQGGVILSRALRLAMDACVPGASTEALDKIVRDEFKRSDAKPSFLGYRISPSDPAYPAALCVSINQEVVHGLAIPDRTIHDGDIVGLDLGLWYQGLATDMASTVMVGNVSAEKRDLVKHTRAALKHGLAAIKAGNWVGDIGAAIEDYIKPKGYGIVKDLVGHGVGHEVHEDPQIPNYREPRNRRVRLEVGMTIAIEPMINLRDWRVTMKDDGWTIETQDGSPSAHFEVTVAVTDGGYELITPWPDQE